MAEAELEQRRDSQVQRRGNEAEQGPAPVRAPAPAADRVPEEVSGHGNRAVADYVQNEVAPPRPDAADPASNAVGTPTADATTTTTGTATGTTTAGTGALATGGAPAAVIPETGVRNQHAFDIVSREVLAGVPADQQAYAQTAVPAILTQAAKLGITDPNQVAYMLATAQHESRFGRPQYTRSQSLVEDHNPFTTRRNGTVTATNHVTGDALRAPDQATMMNRYWDNAYGGRLGNARGTSDAADFRGRGFVQLTGRTNYETMSTRMNNQGFSYSLDGQTYGGRGNPAIDLAANPEHVNRNTDVAARALVDGMRAGQYGHRLDAHINGQQTDWTNARRSVNNDVAANGAHIGGIAQGYAPRVNQYGTWQEVFRPLRTTFGGPR